MKKAIALLISIFLIISTAHSAVMVDSYRYSSTVNCAATATSGNGGWWDTSNAGSITESSGAVSQINDLSGNSRHLTQSNGSNQPTYTANNISFDGTSDFMFNTSPFVFDDGSATILIVAEFPSQAGGRAFLNETNSGNGTITNRASYLRQGTDGGDATYNQVEYWNNATGLLVSTKFGNTAYFNGGVSQYTFNDTGTVVSMRRDSVDGASTGSYSRSGTTTLNRFVLGAFYGSTTEQYADIDFKEMRIYTPALNSTDRNFQEACLKAKWGTP